MLRAVLELAASDSLASGATLCRVCHAVRTWMLPVLYTRVTLTTSSEIARFAYALMSRDAIIPEDEPWPPALTPSTASHVRALWLGPRASSPTANSDLAYDASTWPITLAHQVLARLPALRALGVGQLGQRRWHRLAGVVPTRVRALFLGPVHGALDVMHLPCARALREVTSLDTFMVDAEICALVRAEGVRKVRRVYSSPAHVALAFGQLECVDARAHDLQELEIVCYAGTRDEASRVLAETAANFDYDRERVVLVPREHEGIADGVAALYRDWLAWVGDASDW